MMKKYAFFGNGRQNKYKRHKFRSERKALSKMKKLNAIRQLKDNKVSPVESNMNNKTSNSAILADVRGFLSGKAWMAYATTINLYSIFVALSIEQAVFGFPKFE
ncbi:hypothetical protein WD019_18225 [Fictibacillus sp. Mic-4]|uniref:hypothetical protein n=1 Tax=Fictibacillus sp. Mic-4 TaxID=3132826 RepID=UPI003CEFC634